MFILTLKCQTNFSSNYRWIGMELPKCTRRVLCEARNKRMREREGARARERRRRRHAIRKMRLRETTTTSAEAPRRARRDYTLIKLHTYLINYSYHLFCLFLCTRAEIFFSFLLLLGAAWEEKQRRCGISAVFQRFTLEWAGLACRIIRSLAWWGICKQQA